MRLNGALTNPDPNLKQTIEDYKNRCLDKAAEKRFRLGIETWQEKDKDFGQQIEQNEQNDPNEIDNGNRKEFYVFLNLCLVQTF